jgi:hypothetical protein
LKVKTSSFAFFILSAYLVQHEFLGVLTFYTRWVGLSQRTVSRYCPLLAQKAPYISPLPEFIDPRFREHKNKRSYSVIENERFCARFREIWVYNFGHMSVRGIFTTSVSQSFTIVNHNKIVNNINNLTPTLGSSTVNIIDFVGCLWPKHQIQH